MSNIVASVLALLIGLSLIAGAVRFREITSRTEALEKQLWDATRRVTLLEGDVKIISSRLEKVTNSTDSKDTA